MQLAARRVQACLRRERRQLPRERPEHTSQLVRAQPEVVVAEQPLIATLAVLGHVFAVGARQLDVPLERGCERGEIVVRASLPPALLTVCARARPFGGELLGDAPRALPVAARDARDVAVDLVELRDFAALDLREPLADLRRGRALVGQPRERPELLRPCRRAVGGHHHQLVPIAQHADRGEIRELGHARMQLLQGLHALEPMRRGTPSAVA